MAPETYTDNLKDEDIKVRASEIIASGKTGDKRAIQYLIRILEDRDEIDWLRACAAIALGRLPGEEAIPPLIDALQNDNINVLRAVVSALGDAGSEKAIPHLKSILEDENQKELHPLTVTVLAQTGGRDIISTLLKALESSHTQVRVRAAMALGELRVDEAVLPFMELLKDDDDCLRGVVASSLGLIGDERAVDVLIDALDDSAETVRAIAASSLGCLSDIRALPHLEKALGDSSKTVRKQAAAALSKLRQSLT